MSPPRRHDINTRDFFVRATSPYGWQALHMTERRTVAVPPSQDAVYSEADVAEMRSRWEQAEKDRRFETQLAQLSGQFLALPEMMRAIAREVVVDVLGQQRQDRNKEFDRRTGWANTAAALVQAIMALGMGYLIWRSNAGH